MPDRTRYALTPSQRAHLAMLECAGAHDRASGRCIHDPGMRNTVPGVVAILIDKGFADRRVSRQDGWQRTLYWLTETGRAKAAELIAERVAS